LCVKVSTGTSQSLLSSDLSTYAKPQYAVEEQGRAESTT